MQSTIHLFNTAIARLGGEQIPLNMSSLEDDATGMLCMNLFPHVLDTALVAYEWGFAKKRAVLALLPEQAPANAMYAFRYAMPADCLKPVRLTGAGQSLGLHRSCPYETEGAALLANTEKAELLYVARSTEPKLWPPAFADALAWALAGELAAARVNDTRKQQWCYQNYEIALAKACAQERATQNRPESVSGWQTARGNTLGSPRAERW